METDTSAVIDLADGVYTADSGARFGMVKFPSRTEPLVAGGFPVKPDSTWFANPRFRTLTPLTIDASGRVRGHIAAWHTSHIGMQAGVKPPKSRSKYAFFKTGVLETADGSFVDVGQITLSGGHAALEASVSDAVAHYDNTDSAIMDVNIDEDKHGIWVAGALRPHVDESQIRAIRASSVSGDWRPINGNLELVAVCAVNVPGFPVPRARVAAGMPLALVAAGVEPLVEMAVEREVEGDGEVLQALEDDDTRVRLQQLEGIIASIAVGRRLELREQIDAERVEQRERKIRRSARNGQMRKRGLAASARREADAQILRDRVHVVTASAPPATTTELRARVHGK